MGELTHPGSEEYHWASRLYQHAYDYVYIDQVLAWSCLLVVSELGNLDLWPTMVVELG